jgi:8-oxo-dGTP pyrophosphatase MutT (NUDIX family)
LTFVEALARLHTAFAQPLPGSAAHEVLAPRPRGEWPSGFDPARIRHAAGLLLLFPVDDRPHVVLTVRAGTLGRHGGQVSLPGGVIDRGETVEQAALREAREEVALPPDGVRVLGVLTPLDIPVSGFRLHPVVAAIDARPALVASDGEVARILDAPVDELLDPANFVATERIREGHVQVVPAFRVGGEEIWGATAMALAEFLTLLGWRGRSVA